jgi:CRP-like cAMP-binding protein
MVECQYHKDYVIFEQGQPADCFYILLSGEVRIRYKPYDGPPLKVSCIEPGGVFGWTAAMRHDVYTSGAMALQDSVAYCMRGASLSVIRAKYPETCQVWLERLASVIAQRLESTHAQVLGMLAQGIERDGLPGKSNRKVGLRENERK